MKIRDWLVRKDKHSAKKRAGQHARPGETDLVCLAKQGRLAAFFCLTKHRGIGWGHATLYRNTLQGVATIIPLTAGGSVLVTAVAAYSTPLPTSEGPAGKKTPRPRGKREKKKKKRKTKRQTTFFPKPKKKIFFLREVGDTKASRTGAGRSWLARHKKKETQQGLPKHQTHAMLAASEVPMRRC